MNKHKKVLFAVFTVILVAAYFVGGAVFKKFNEKNFEDTEQTLKTTETAQNITLPAADGVHTETNGGDISSKSENEEREKEAEVKETPPANETKTPSDNAEKPKDTENNKTTCKLSVYCDNILDKLSDDNSIKEILPKDGIIFREQDVVFSEGESAFDVLLNEMKKNKIHLEFSKTPVYNSAYIEGIANVYEFDAGDLSGWMYIVNGEVMNYGCSEYKVRENDRLQFVYTCNGGGDIKKYLKCPK